MVECDARGRVTERSWMYRLPAPKGGGVSWEKKQKLATPGMGHGLRGKRFEGEMKGAGTNFALFFENHFG